MSETLRRPYHWTIIPEADGTFFAHIEEFPGCFATGDTMEEAVGTLREVAESWLMSVEAQGQAVPEPKP